MCHSDPGNFISWGFSSWQVQPCWAGSRRKARLIAAPGPPGWRLSDGLITVPCKTLILQKPEILFKEFIMAKTKGLAKHNRMKTLSLYQGRMTSTGVSSIEARQTNKSLLKPKELTAMWRIG